jgi:hypothetical protein
MVGVDCGIARAVIFFFLPPRHLFVKKTENGIFGTPIILSNFCFALYLAQIKKEKRKKEEAVAFIHPRVARSDFIKNKRKKEKRKNAKR